MPFVSSSDEIRHAFTQLVPILPAQAKATLASEYLPRSLRATPCCARQLRSAGRSPGPSPEIQLRPRTSPGCITPCLGCTRLRHFSGLSRLPSQNTGWLLCFLFRIERMIPLLFHASVSFGSSSMVLSKALAASSYLPELVRALPNFSQ